jgi:hypothetical protein
MGLRRRHFEANELRSVINMVAGALDGIELHDAVVESVNIDFSAASVTILVAYYPSPESQQRVRVKLNFENVESISQITDFARLRENAVAGNINYWRPGDTGGATYIYLVDGCIVITARIVRIDPT